MKEGRWTESQRRTALALPQPVSERGSLIELFPLNYTRVCRILIRSWPKSCCTDATSAREFVVSGIRRISGGISIRAMPKK
jgi:hypothetical protein